MLFTVILAVALLLQLRCTAAQPPPPPQQYQWADSRYPLRGCGGAPNRLGGLTLTNDLAAQYLSLRFDLDRPFTSCYLCEQYATCGAVSPDSLYLALDAHANLQLLLMRDGQPQALHQYNVESDLGQRILVSNLTLPLADLGLAAPCGARLQLLVGALLTLDEPVNKDLYALAYTPGTAAAVNCTPHALYDAMGINCADTPLLYPIVYEVRQCVATRNETPVPPVELRQWQPLYWYHTLLFDNATALPPPLCGEPIDVALFRTRLYQQWCYGVAVNRTCEWWDQLLVRYAVLWLNAARAADDTVMVRVALEQMRSLLERSCAQRHTCITAPLPVIADYYTALEAADNASLCRELRDYFEAHYHQPAEDFMSQFEAWYRSTFHALIYPDRAFTTKAVLFVMGVFFTLLFMVFGVGIGGFQMRVKVKKFRAT